MEFNLTTSDGSPYTAHDVTCVFDYGDGLTDEFNYYPEMKFPVTGYHHKYHPNKNTIASVVTVEVICRLVYGW